MGADRVEATRVEIEFGDFDDFFRAHHPAVVRSLSLALGNDQLGRDAASEGFAKALQRWGRVSQFDNPQGWVYRVGLNWGRSRWRRTRREVSDQVTSDARRSMVDPEPHDPRLVPAVRGLSVEHRSVIIARFYLDWSEQQIADALGIRPGTVKSRLSRALERLAAELDAP